MKSLLTLLSILILSTACQKKNFSLKKHERVNAVGLSTEASNYRSSAIKDVNYLFEIDLSTVAKSTLYSGTSTIIFNAQKAKLHKSLTVDFNKGQVSSLFINGTKEEKINYNDHFITISASKLKEGKNTVKIKFSQEYSKNGSGLYRFIDQTDGRTYVYTDFEPYDANMFAPMFDQPNLKAHYNIIVKAPKNFKVISSVKEQNIDSSHKVFNMWTFPKSKKFSTYIFSLHAGPYDVWENLYTSPHGNKIPLKLFARKSISKHVDPDFWFKISKQGFTFFESYFSTPYPYEKYDQVLVPDFNSGAMENVAAVTFNERYVSREAVRARNNRRGLASVILHEMAHMWFGNLVTMNWWNDLWLNESFASFMAARSLYEATEFKESWVNFLSTKQWAYGQDELRTTHPIETEVPSTTEATSNFDGITYGKGASTLKQLVFLIGEDSFKKGLKEYFEKYKEQNTERKDFIEALQNNTSENLNGWTKKWLQLEGLTLLSPSFKCAEGNLKEVSLVQSYLSGDKQARPHKTLLSFWGSDPKSPFKIVAVKYDGNSTTWKPSEKITCPEALFPNTDDHDYTRLSFDEKSLSYFSKNLAQIKSDLTRKQIWATLNFMLKSGKLDPTKVVSMITSNLTTEKSAVVASQALRLLDPYFPVFYFYKDKNKAKRDQNDISNFLRVLIERRKSLDLKKLYFSYWSGVTYESKPGELVSCLKSSCTYKVGFKLDLDKKWDLLKRLATLRHPETRLLLKSLKKQDSSRTAELNEVYINAVLSKNKAGALKDVLSKDTISLKEKITTIYGLTPFTQRKENLDFQQKSFSKYVDTLKDRGHRVQRIFTRSLSPYSCGDSTKKGPTVAEITSSDWPFGVKKELLGQFDKNEKCLKIKNFNQGQK